MKFDFLNKEGETLAGRLEMPSGPPRTFALFAHCFTCSKDIIAPNSISKSLTENGIAVLRFDFTGLGNSQGDFSNTNFSSNVSDLLSACSALSEKFKAPEILIGHSLGGAAVLKAATELPSVKAVVTLAAPSDVEHVTHLFSDSLDTIENEGSAEVKLAGRPFKIKKQFVDDLKQTELLDGVSKFKKALLVMHAPTDQLVSVDHAANIFLAAKHPKSFVSLDKADHLLMKRSDAEYAGQVIGSWVLRYISDASNSSQKIKPQTGEVLVKSRPGTKFTQDIYTSDHHGVADEPTSIQGNNLGMTPYDLLLSGLGACTSMTLRMYADRKGWDLKGVEVELSQQKIHAKDCEDCETETGKVDEIQKDIRVTGDLSEEQVAKLKEIAEKCPVNRTLLSETKIRPSIQWVPSD